MINGFLKQKNPNKMIEAKWTHQNDRLKKNSFLEVIMNVHFGGKSLYSFPTMSYGMETFFLGLLPEGGSYHDVSLSGTTGDNGTLPGLAQGVPSYFPQTVTVIYRINSEPPIQ